MSGLSSVQACSVIPHRRNGSISGSRAGGYNSTEIVAGELGFEPRLTESEPHAQRGFCKAFSPTEGKGRHARSIGYGQVPNRKWPPCATKRRRNLRCQNIVELIDCLIDDALEAAATVAGCVEMGALAVSVVVDWIP
jgi:hypothetical protein